ncbi:MAG: conjugal transfer protein TraF [Nitrospinae bacterium]|nr:conjugal transfer protein TraF [Nitrospinota bacterium]
MNMIALLLTLLALPAMFTSPAWAGKECEYCRGFYWHETTASDEKQKDDGKSREDKRKALNLPTPAVPPPLKEVYTKEELMKMHPDQFEPLARMYMRKAVGERSPQNVKDYQDVQDAARKMGVQFGNVWQYNLQTNPEMSLDQEYPVSMEGINERLSSRDQEVAERIAREREDFALLYFYSPTCGYCKFQDEYLIQFMQAFNWRLCPETAANGGLQTDNCEIIKMDVQKWPALKLRYKAQSTPFIVLLHKNSSFSIAVGPGLTTMTDLAYNIYRGIRLMKGEITPEQYTMMESERGKGFDPTASKPPQ